MLEVSLVCPRCEKRSVGYVARESRLKIRHSGHYELTCRECLDKLPVVIRVEEMVFYFNHGVPVRTGFPRLSLEGATTSKWNSDQPNS